MNRYLGSKEGRTLILPQMIGKTLFNRHGGLILFEKSMGGGGWDGEGGVEGLEGERTRIVV